MEMNSKELRLDRMCYSKDKIPQMLSYIGIIFDVLYFVTIYKLNGTFYYKYMIGISVIVNLLFMLVGFLCSEGVKSYKKGYGIAMCVLGVIEIVRIFILPTKAHAEIINEETLETAMNTLTYVKCIIYLSATAVAMIAGGVLSEINSYKLANYKASLNK